jgi:hypothetical protein
MAGIHSHDGLTPHSHDHGAFNTAEHGHSHDILDGPGSYMGREMPLIEGRDWSDRAFTIGIGGYAPLCQEPVYHAASDAPRHLPTSLQNANQSPQTAP